MGGGGLGLGGEEMGGEDLELGGEEMAGEEAELEGETPPEAGTPEAAPEGELLAAPPGKRDEDWYKVKRRGDGKTTTPNAKGKWYKPVTKDKRDQGASRRSRRSKYAYEAGKATRRNTHEDAETNYNKEDKTEELKLFEINREVRNLISELQEKKKPKTLEPTKDESKVEA